LVLKDSSPNKSHSKKPLNLKEKSMKKADPKVKKSASSKTSKRSLETNQSVDDS
jgi:hypothetical protein